MADRQGPSQGSLFDIEPESGDRTGVKDPSAGAPDGDANQSEGERSDPIAQQEARLEQGEHKAQPEVGPPESQYPGPSPTVSEPNGDLDTDGLEHPGVEAPELVWLDQDVEAEPSPDARIGPRRHFLGWDRPLLYQAVDWLFHHAASDGVEFGFNSTLVVVPGRRSGRTLLERLSREAVKRGRAALLLPEIVTPGALPERLLELDLAQRSEAVSRAFIANALTRFAADKDRVATVEEALGDLPAGDDLLAWLELAERIERLRAEVGALGIGLPLARTRLEERLSEVSEEGERWLALVQVDQWLRDALSSVSGTSRSVARVEGLRREECQAPDRLPKRVVLIGLAELAPVFRKTLDLAYHRENGQATAEDHGESVGGVDALVHAPDEEHERFDRWGCPTAVGWSVRSGPLVEAKRRACTAQGSVQSFVERPGDQIAAAIGAIDQWCNDGDVQRLADVSVGVGEEASALRLVEALRARGLAGHSPFGQRLDQTEPALAIRRVARFDTEGSLRSLHEALQVPLVYRWVKGQLDSEIPGCGGESGGPDTETRFRDRLVRRAWIQRDLLSFVERIAVLRLGESGVGEGPASEDSTDQILQRVQCAVRSLFVEENPESMRDPGVRRSLADCVELLVLGLRRLFVPTEESEDSQSTETDPDNALAAPAANERALDRNGLDAVVALVDLLRSADTLSDPLELTLDEACKVLFFDQTQRLASDDAQEAIEIVGWLELAMDPAHAVVVTDLNEGVIPTRSPSDPLLPESMRTTLGLSTDAERLARDAFLLAALINSRDRVHLLSCRRTELGEPLLPSRLLLDGEGEPLAERVLAAFAPGHLSADTSASSDARLWLVGRSLNAEGIADDERSLELSTSDFAVTPPSRQELLSLDLFAERISRLRVTDFKAYLACPYRFFLRRILQVDPAPEWLMELDPGRFGTLVHEVLRRFGQRREADAVDAELIERTLNALTDKQVERDLGSNPPAPVRVQVEHLRRRLERFARWHAKSNAAGWQLQRGLSERELRYSLDVDGRPVELVGRIDRVDLHPEFGYRLIDYKTSDTPAEPSKAIKREKVPDSTGGFTLQERWVDLQLPLYRTMARANSALFDPSLAIEVGLVRLSKKLRASTYRAAQWGAAKDAEALEAACSIVRDLRDARFWPPALPPRFADGLEWLAGDTLPLLANESVSQGAPAPSPDPEEGLA